MIRLALFLFLALFCTMSVGASCGNAQELRRIHYGTSVSISHLPVWVAKDAGIFAKKGLVVAKYIKNRRLDLCAQSLRQSCTEEKLSVLGYSWGFSDSSYFSTAFKSRFGISPGEYRKTRA